MVQVSLLVHYVLMFRCEWCRVSVAAGAATSITGLPCTAASASYQYGPVSAASQGSRYASNIAAGTAIAATAAVPLVLAPFSYGDSLLFLALLT